MGSDLDDLQGTWRVTSLETDGEKIPESAFAGAKIVVEGNKFNSLGMGGTYQGIVKLDPDRKPKAFDLSFTSGHAKGHTNLGIYRLKGDHWTLCLATRGDKRPKSFTTRPDTGFALETLARESTGTKSAQNRSKGRLSNVSPDVSAGEPGKVAAGSATELEGEWSMVAAVFDGAAMDKNMVKWCTRVTHANRTKVLAGGQVFLDASFTLDSSKKPHVIEYLNLSGENKGKQQEGIFELSGDTLRICMSPPGKTRPSDFNSKRGDGRSFTTWRFLKK